MINVLEIKSKYIWIWKNLTFYKNVVVGVYLFIDDTVNNNNNMHFDYVPQEIIEFWYLCFWTKTKLYLGIVSVVIYEW